MADIFKKFNSIKEFNRYLDTHSTTRYFWSNESSLSTDPYIADWTGTASYEEAQNLLLYGDKELQSEIESQGVAKERIKLARFANRRQVYSSIVGFAPNVPNYIAGVPNAMINARQQRVKQNVVNVFYNCGITYGVEPEDVRRMVAKLICALMRIEASGIRINLYTGSNSWDGKRGSKQYVTFAVKVKDSGQPFDTLKMCYPLAHPSMNRRQKFRFLEVTEGVIKAYSNQHGHSVRDDNETMQVLRKNGMKVDCVFNYESVEYASIEDIVKRITNNK